MKDGLIDKINSHGHWRVNIRPTRDINETMSFQKSREVVERSSVSIRGWNYPHVSRRSDDYGGIANGENFVESWTDWDGFIEFWRMYRSSQFLSYFCLRSDTGAMGQELSGARELSILDAIYSITEFLEFAHRVHGEGLYPDGASISVKLKNNKGRCLSVGPNRMPFYDPKMSNADEISIEQDLSRDILNDGYKEIAVKILLELFDHFEWNPDPNQIRTDQERFYNRDFRY